MYQSRINSLLLVGLTVLLTGVLAFQAQAAQSACIQFYDHDLPSKLKRYIETNGGKIRTGLDLGYNRSIAIIDPGIAGKSPQILIEPKLTPMTNKKSHHLEGCLGGIEACRLVSRFDHVRINFKDENGSHQVIELHDKLAHLAQKKFEALEGKSTESPSVIKKIKDYLKIAKGHKHLANPTQKIVKLLEQAIEESYNPYTLAYDVRKLYPKDHSFEQAIASLSAIFQKNSLRKTTGEELEQWVTSEEHALFIFSLMTTTGLTYFKKELDYLLENSVYFSNSLKSGDSLVTYSFEKEGNSSDITYLYRPVQYSEKEWIEKSDEERFEILLNTRLPTKKFLSADRIMPTDFKPSAVGGYSKEVGDHRRRGFGWEISHKKFEINYQRLMTFVREVSQIFRQTHSFHIHISFEIPKIYTFYSNFIFWFKHLNDYLYLKGLEEGLHGNYLTGVANLDRDLSTLEKARGFAESLYTKKTIVESQDKLNARNSKFFSAGLRGEIYGPGSNPDTMRIGIELRDSTRDLNILNENVETVGKSVSTRIWESSDLAEIQSHGLRLTNDRKKTKEMLSQYLTPKFARLFSEAEPTAAFGLIQYEQSRIFNYKTNSWVSLTKEKVDMIKSARDLYIKDLTDIQRELGELEAKGEKTETELISAAIRMSLATWAKQAQVAELFKHY